MNASNNDYWVGDLEVDSGPTFLEWFPAFPRWGARSTKRDRKGGGKDSKDRYGGKDREDRYPY